VAGGLLVVLPADRPPGEEGETLRRFARARRAQLVASGVGFVGLLSTHVWNERFLGGDNDAYLRHPILGPLSIFFSVVFFAGLILRFFVAYYGAKAHRARPGNPPAA
jgi:hypothetical protein